MKLRIRVEDRDYEVDVEYLDQDAAPRGEENGAVGIQIPASVIRERPPQKLPEDMFGRSPIAGTVTAVVAPVGSRVSKNEPVVLLEAMKMEIKVGPVVDGIIEAIRVAPGETVASGQVLFELA